MWQKQKRENPNMRSLKTTFLGRVFGLDANAPTSRALQRLKSFNSDQSGNVGMIFGGTLMAMVVGVGGAVDYGRWLNARNQTQNAMDAASLAAGRVLQIGGTPIQAIAAGDAYYLQMKSKLVIPTGDPSGFGDSVKFQQPTLGNTAVNAAGSSYIATPFLSIIGIDKMPVVADAATVSGSCIGVNCDVGSGGGGGGNLGTSIEISMMLDTTGSMSGTKLAALKVAAKELVDIVVWEDQSQYTSRVAIAPFSDSVNVGSQYFTAVTNEPLYEQVIVGYTSFTYPNSCRKNDGSIMSNCFEKKQYGVGPIYGNGAARATCVVERAGVNEFTDVSPAGTGTSSTNTSMIPWNGSTGACGEATAIQPLTANKDTLKDAINGLVANNYTAGALGTAWAWYLLSPNWSNVFTGSAIQPQPYSMLTELNASGKPKLRKIAILMTDGAYNTWHSAHDDDNSDFAVNVQTKAKALCTAMKAKGIIVYTVGFQLGTGNNAKNTLSDCASSHTIDSGASVKNFYNVDTPSALQSAFRDIALQISNLRLSH
jgi:hypothetical protein